MAELLCFLDAHNGALTAVATVVIAVFTVVLAFVSRRQARLIETQVKLARQEFAATHRPKVVIRSFQFLNPDFLMTKAQPNVCVVLANIGESAGKVIEVRGGTLVHKRAEQLPGDLSFPLREAFTLPSATLASGRQEVFPLNNFGQLSATDAALIDSGVMALHFIGTVVYVDEAGIRRETGFCRRYYARAHRWETIAGQYEYVN
jgi:hypothetical protein